MSRRSAELAERFIPAAALRGVGLEHKERLGELATFHALVSVAPGKKISEMNLAERVMLNVRFNHELTEGKVAR